MPRACHLFVLIHGLWGDRSHLALMEEVLLDALGTPTTATGAAPGEDLDDDGKGVDVRVLRVKGNENDKTYDGIDINASRAVEELDAEIARLEAEGLDVAFLSVAGYSLGGLVARYALGILATRPTFFTDHVPANFATFASPWLGGVRYATLFNRLFTAVGSRFVSRTGEQLFCADKDQLVARLARKDDIFYRALARFARIDVFASAQADKTVPFPSGAFVADDPFEQWETSGLSVELHADSPIIKSYHVPSAAPSAGPSPPTTPASSSASSSTLLGEPKPIGGSSLSPLPTSPDPNALAPSASKPRKKHLLPPFLRFQFPLNILLYLFLPFLMPIALGLILFRLGRESRRSRVRLRGEATDGVWARVRELERALEEELAGVGIEEDAEERGVVGAVVDVVDKGRKGGLRLTASQHAMIRSLDQLPNLSKWFAFFPDAFNSHAVIIGRDPVRFPDHGKGREVLRFWADRVELAPEPPALVKRAAGGAL